MTKKTIGQMMSDVVYEYKTIQYHRKLLDNKINILIKKAFNEYPFLMNFKFNNKMSFVKNFIKNENSFIKYKICGG